MGSLETLFGSITDNVVNWMGNMPNVHITDIVEVIIIAFLLYEMMVWIKNTRAWALLKGLIVILAFILVAVVFQMNTILWIAERTINIAVIALVIIFQPELRSALEQLGRRRFITAFFSTKNDLEKFSEKTINELVKACYEMGKVKTGALIVVENEIKLAEYERTGIYLDSLVSSQLLLNIFEKNTPLHDGAIIVRGNRVVSATCYLPLSDSMELSKELGTRHRAALGVSEVSDSLTIVVSEETGKVSIAINRELYRNVDAEFLRDKLRFLQKINEEPQHKNMIQRRLSHVKETFKSGDK